MTGLYRIRRMWALFCMARRVRQRVGFWRSIPPQILPVGMICLESHKGSDQLFLSHCGMLVGGAGLVYAFWRRWADNENGFRTASASLLVFTYMVLTLYSVGIITVT